MCTGGAAGALFPRRTDRGRISPRSTARQERGPRDHYPRPDPTTRTYTTTDPATGQVEREYSTVDEAEAETLLASAHSAHLEWRATSLEQRIGLFQTLADLVSSHTDELAHQITLEMGKPLAQSEAEVAIAVEILQYYVEHAARLLADREIEVPGTSWALTRPEPLGVVLGIQPWNGPVHAAIKVAAPNLMLGNSVPLKPSEVSPGSTLLLDDLFAEAGLPPHVYQTALVSTEQVSGYLADVRVRAVALTGSDRTGSIIGEQAGRHITPAVLELGGSDAFIVLDSADVETSAAVASAARLAIGGQICASPKRIIVTDSVADDFIDRFTQAFADHRLGDPFDPETTVGPMSSVAAADRLEAQYRDAVLLGAAEVLPGGRLPGPGAYFAPAVITGVTPEMRVHHEEAFGPLAVIYRVADADAAVELANDSPFGLGGTVFAQDVEDARSVAERLDIGMVGINTYLGAAVEIPFGGTKRSGFGRELGPRGMEAFANVKTYAVG